MRRSPEHELDSLIDTLNHEQQPKQRMTSEMAQMLAVVRAVRTLREPASPSRDFGDRICAVMKRRPRRRWAMVTVAALAAGLLLCIALTNRIGLFDRNVVYAMDKAVSRLSNYYGVLEMRAENADGEEWMVRRVEIWSEGDKYATRLDDGTLTVNNGERCWQVRPGEREVALLPLVPGAAHRAFDLRDEAKRAKQYPHLIVGQEMIAGRQATKIEISPPGGLPYYLWVDVETDLPLQLQTAMQNALLSTYTFTSFEPNTNIDSEVFIFQPPEGYRLIEKDPGQLVATAAEAAEISQFAPLLPKEPPVRIFAFQDSIVLDYGHTTVSETPAKGPFEPAGFGAMGSAAGGPLEVIGERLRWRQEGIEISTEGPKRIELARQIASDLCLPDSGESLVSKAQIQVTVDMEIARADQQQVDGGHSPWQLDPMQVALTFVNLQVSPEESKESRRCKWIHLTSWPIMG
jgi:outer membrane lipoprotein-sorting protein